ncbi:MAG TPA: type II secretion system protein [Chthoniobacterales bacterium]|nr:type II secretion system protein [Chthoniobacterales bacterium]
MRKNSGFTLVEIMIVVAIIALLAVIALPSFLRARQQAQNAKFINALRVATNAIETYSFEHSAYPPDSTRGIVPPGMETYLDQTLGWNGTTPIGGQWDWDFDVFGIKAAVSVVGTNLNVAQLTEIDTRYDDGNLTTGRFQNLAAERYSDIVER